MSASTAGFSVRPRGRELAHRRALLLAVAGLTVFSMSPVFGHHMAPRAVGLFSGDEHVLNVCLVALHELLGPVHEGFHLLLAIGLAYAAWDRARAWSRLRHALGSLRNAGPPPHESPLWRAAQSVGLDGESLRVVNGLSAPAFTAGWIRPRIFISSRLTDVLNIDQLGAVIAHEAAHVRARDPLRLSGLRFLANTLFYMPALRRLVDDLADEAEVAADDAATRGSSSQRLVLASAILALAEQGVGFGQALPVGAVGFQRVDLLDRRIRRLAGEDAPLGTRVTGRSLSGAAAILVAVWISGVAMARPLGAASNGSAAMTTMSSLPERVDLEHCQHHRAWAISHLFCLGLHSHGDAAHCPHTGR